MKLSEIKPNQNNPRLIKDDTFSQKNNVKKELVRVSIRVDDKNFDYSYLKKEKGYEFLSVEKYENNENPNFKRWLIIVSYFRDLKRAI